MARASHTVKIRLEAEDRASGEIQKVSGGVSGLSKRLKVGLVAAAAAAALALRSLFNGFKGAIKAASEQEDAVNKLNASLASLGDESEGVSKRLQEQAAALQKVTTAGDETIIKGQALIATFTKDEEAIKKATVAALNLSAATGQSLQSAFLLLGKAAKGETSTLSRYGIVLDENLGKNEKFAAALALINEQFGGQAQAEAKTYSGLVAQVGNAFGDLKEKLAEAFTQNEKILGVFTRLRDTLSSEGTIAAVLSFGEAIAAIAVKTAEAATKIGEYIAKIRELTAAQAASREAQQIHADQTRDLNWLVGKLAEGYGAMGARFDEAMTLQQRLDAINKGLIISTSDLTDEQRLAQLEALGLADAYRQNTDAVNDMSGANDRATDSTSNLTDAQKDALNALRELGVVLDQDVNDKLGKNADLLEFARQNARALGLDTRELAQAEQLLSANSAELTASLTEQGAVVSETAVSYESAAGGLRYYRDEAMQTIGVVQQLGQAIATTGAAATGMGSRTGSGQVSGQADLGRQVLAGLTAYGGILRDATGSEVYNISPGGTVSGGGGGGGAGGYSVGTYSADWWIERGREDFDRYRSSSGQYGASIGVVR